MDFQGRGGEGQTRHLWGPACPPKPLSFSFKSTRAVFSEGKRSPLIFASRDQDSDRRQKAMLSFRKVMISLSTANTIFRHCWKYGQFSLPLECNRESALLGERKNRFCFAVYQP